MFKPDRDFDFDGPTAGVNLRWLTTPKAAPTGRRARRRARSTAASAGPRTWARAARRPPCPGTAMRTDDFVMGQAEVTRTGRVLLGVGYVFQHNASNSFGETLIRHIAIARVATALPLGFYLAARADLLFASTATRSRSRRPRHAPDDRRQAVRQHRGREPLQLACRPVARHLRPPARAVRYTFSRTSWAAASAPTAATRCCCPSPSSSRMICREAALALATAQVGEG